MSIEKSFGLLNAELENLKKIFEAEIQRHQSEHAAGVEALARASALDVSLLEAKARELEARVVRVADTRPIEREFLECLPAMAFICDAAGEFVECNSAFKNFFGSDKFPFPIEAVEAARERGSWGDEIALVSTAGAECVFDARLFSWNKNSGSLGGFVGVTMDKTRLKAAERELQSLRGRINSLNMQLGEKSDGSPWRKELRCVVFGECGSGKTSLLNGLIGQDVFSHGVSARCARGERRALAVHYWNGEKRLFLDGLASNEKAAEFFGSDESLWLEWRLPDAKIPGSIVLEEAEELPNKADMLIALLPIRGRFAHRTLEALEQSLKDGAYCVFVITKIDLETDDCEGGKTAATAKQKIVAACDELRRDLARFRRLRGCPLIPLSVKEGLNVDVLRWHIEDAAASVRASAFEANAIGANVPGIKFPEGVRPAPAQTALINPLLPMVETFRDQEFQTKFASCVSIFEKNACVLLGSRRSDAHKLISRLAHDISFAGRLAGTEKLWVVLSEENLALPFKRWIESILIAPPESILKTARFLLAPEDGELDIYDWDALFSEYTPVVTLSPEIENAPYSDALKRHGFCVACGDGLMFDKNKFDAEARRLKKFAGFDVPFFLSENYEVRGAE